MSDSGANHCRCGHEKDSRGPHPCHGQGYTCGRPATQRFYGLRRVCLAGAMPKVGASDTWACDACWEMFQIAIGDSLGTCHLQQEK